MTKGDIQMAEIKQNQMTQEGYDELVKEVRLYGEITG